MANGSPCHRCRRTRRILLQTDYVNTKIERSLFPKGKLVCKQCGSKSPRQTTLLLASGRLHRICLQIVRNFL